ncbi:MAG: zinc-ribbon domain-containing protein [Alphaproteobacteria bacterium]|nr:zinc-ribbon domain-containing protein [Alphaproteobacteria bacterium]
MIITCPNCSTKFGVPDKALGNGGRMLKCARCEHKWHQYPLDDFASEPEPEPEPAPAPKPKPAPKPAPKAQPRAAAKPDPDLPSESDGDGGGDFAAALSAVASRSDLPLEMDASDRPAAEPDFLSEPSDDDMPMFDEPEDEGFGASARGDQGGLPDFDDLMSDPPEPIPDIFGDRPEQGGRRRRGLGAVAATLLVLLLVVGAGGFAAWSLQDRVIDMFPAADGYLRQFGLRQEVVGAGLEFRNYSSERRVVGETEMLIVRGVIVNMGDAPRELPFLRLTLYDNDVMVQEKSFEPPSQEIGANATLAFGVTLDQPNPAASRVTITFAPRNPPPKPNS